MKNLRIGRVVACGAGLSLVVGVSALALRQGLSSLSTWDGLGRNGQHSANQAASVQTMAHILWHTPVDLHPQYSGSDLLTHYGSILITASNTVILPVKTGYDDGFQIEARHGSDGSLIWVAQTTYSLPPHDWIPSCGPTLLLHYKVSWPESGGRITIRGSADDSVATGKIRAFYGYDSYNADPADFDANVKICTPMTAGSDGSVYFGYIVLGNAPLIGGGQLLSGFARVGPDGTGSWVSAPAAAHDNGVSQCPLNAAPAISNDGQTVYFVASGGGYSAGDLVGLDPNTFATKYVVRLKDPRTGYDAGVDDDGTASPMVGPDGDAYIGVLEDPFGSNHDRGWLLHYDATLSTTKLPGAFGWDDTPSIVPASAVPFYHGPSSYLVMSKYNNYAGYGDGVNRVAMIDPIVSEVDSISGVTVMKVVASQIGPTPDTYARENGYPHAVREWCVNSTAIDPISKCAIVNNEDGHCYKWSFITNKLTENMPLNNGIGEAYTSTVIGVNGVAYAVNNATLYALGTHP